MLVAARNLVEQVRSRRHLARVGDTPIERPISVDEREGSWWNKKWMCAFCFAAVD